MQHYIGGEGGTGKSRVIHAILAFFNFYNCQSQILPTATTGRAAVGISGATIHSSLGINEQDDKKKKKYTKPTTSQTLKRKQKLQSDPALININTILLDEVSMSSSEFWDEYALKSIGLLKQSKLNFPITLAYGIDLTLVGDFFQHDPIGGTPLYKSVPDGEKGCSMHKLWKNLSSAVILTRNFRTPDPILNPILSSMRAHKMTPEQLDVLYGRLISIPSISSIKSGETLQ